MASAPNAVDWAKLAAKLPWGKDAESTKARKAIFRDWDPDGNGQLSLAEIDRGLVMMKLEIPKPVMMRAYQAARSVNKEDGKAGGGQNDDFVDWTEFRVLLQYIRQYMELWVMFDSLDVEKDRKLTPVEFGKAVPLLEKWGIKISDAAASFKEIDKDGGGSILFDEFAHWAIHQQLKLGGGVEHVVGGEGSGLITAPTSGGKVKGSQRKGAGAAEEKKQETKKIDWANVAKRLPWGKDDAAHQERQVMFRQFDPNNNGMLSLAEVDKGIIEVGLGDICCKAVIIRAFQAARQFTPGDKRTSDDYLDFGHFRVFLLYVRRYLELWVMFDAIDADKDRRIQKAEFSKSFALLKDFGLQVDDAEATFKEVDVRGTGTILFDEFADWAIKKKFSLPDAEKTEDPGMGSGRIKKGFTSKLGAALLAADKSGKPLQEEKKPVDKKNVNWKEVADKLPWGTDEASAQKRKRLFRTFDPNGNGLLSLAEVDKGVVLDLGLGDICSKACIMRAFKAASTINQSGSNANNDYVDFTEFRMLLLYLRQYIELWVMFDAIDTNKDRKIEQKEFANAAALVSKWGFKIDNMDATYKEIDADGAGKILFDEFADWAIRKKLALEDGDGAPRAGTGSGLIAKAGTAAAGAGPSKKPAASAPAAPAPKAIDWADVARKLPWGRDEESEKRRKKLFKVFDPNGNGLLSLAEVDKGVGEDLKMGDVICKAVIMRAYQAAKNVNKQEGSNDDYIDFTEFRTLLLYLRQYLELWVMFDAIDTNKDKRIEASEFAGAAKLVEKWGIPIADPVAVFKEIDLDGGGMILFDEFADWAINKKLELPDADDAEKGGAGAGVARTGPDVKPKGTKPSPAKSPAPKATGRSAPGKSPAPKATPAAATPATKTPAAAAPKPTPKTPTSPTAKAGPPKATPPKKEDTKEAPKITVGVKFDANEDNGVIVIQVTADTPAAKADIQVGDKLVSIGGKPIQKKADFGALVPTFVAGASFDVVVKRADKDVNLKLSF